MKCQLLTFERANYLLFRGDLKPNFYSCIFQVNVSAAPIMRPTSAESNQNDGNKTKRSTAAPNWFKSLEQTKTRKDLVN